MINDKTATRVLLALIFWGLKVNTSTEPELEPGSGFALLEQERNSLRSRILALDKEKAGLTLELNEVLEEIASFEGTTPENRAKAIIERNENELRRGVRSLESIPNLIQQITEIAVTGYKTDEIIRCFSELNRMPAWVKPENESILTILQEIRDGIGAHQHAFQSRKTALMP